MVIDLPPRRFRGDDVLLVMKVFKFTLSSLSYDALSIEAFQQILTHIMLGGVVLKMLKIRPEMTVSKTSEVIDALSFLLMDTFPHLLVLPRLMFRFQNAPKMPAVLPFSILRALTHSLNIKVNHKIEHNQRSDIRDGFFCRLNISLAIRPSKEELNEFLDACFLRLNTLFESQAKAGNSATACVLCL
jgi:hypothetical protein